MSDVPRPGGVSKQKILELSKSSKELLNEVDDAGKDLTLLIKEITELSTLLEQSKTIIKDMQNQINANPSLSHSLTTYEELLKNLKSAIQRKTKLVVDTFGESLKAEEHVKEDIGNVLGKLKNI